METKEEAILKATETMVRRGGYNGFSFREIAKEVGVKSSSVHYYFPTKEDLGIAVTRYYTDRFFESLGSPDTLKANGKDPITVYIAAFRYALTQDKRMCLCGMFGAEIDGLPQGVVTQTQEFFSRNLDWLEQAYNIKKHSEARKKAMQTLSLLQGALISSNALGDEQLFEHATEILR